MKTFHPFHRRIVSDAWHIAWTHKHLWLFGFFAAMIGFGGVTEPVFNASDRVYAMMPGLSGHAPAGTMPGLATFTAILGGTGYPALTFLLLALGLAFCAAIFTWMTYSSVGALIGAIRKVERGGDASFADDVKIGAENFWRVLGVNVWAQLFVLAAFLLTAATLEQVMRVGGVMEGLFYIGAFIMFMAFAVGASVAAIYATCEVVVKGRGVRFALEEGANLVADHWLTALEMALVSLGCSVAIGIAAMVCAALGAIPFLFFLYVAHAAGADAVSTIIITTAGTLLIGLIAITGSLITVFQVSTWTLLWSHITGEKHVLPKLMRMLRRHVDLSWLA
ncbi:MAG: hypothetical protein RLZZ324_256 [Candidatus Parcubacteria bacterium]|jgi:hypothetical protein